jgi:hypothetical protein
MNADGNNRERDNRERRRVVQVNRTRDEPADVNERDNDKQPPGLGGPRAIVLGARHCASTLECSCQLSLEL